MRPLNLILILLAGLLFCSCKHVNTESGSKENNAKKNKAANKKLTVIIQPFDDFPAASTLFIANELTKIFPETVISKPVNFPSDALNQTKTRYRADSLIRFLAANTTEGTHTLGITDKDISTTKGKFPDWGVMGLGYCPGKSCIASSFRLKGKNRLEKLYKVAIHELGHTMGLSHCPEKTCFMRDAEGKDHLDEEKEFCPKCKAILTKAGWTLK